MILNGKGIYGKTEKYIVFYCGSAAGGQLGMHGKYLSGDAEL